jgi:hypothetical protein
MRLPAAFCVLIALFGTKGFCQENVQRLKKLGPLPQSQAAAQTDDDLAWFNTAEGRAWLKTPQGKAISKALSNLEGEIDKTNQHVRELLAGQVELNVAITKLERTQKPKADTESPDFSLVKLHLAGWKSACSQEMDKGVVMALAEGKPALTYQAATALDCTEGLRNIMQEIVATLDTRTQ